MFEKVHCPLQTSRFCYIFRHEESFEVIADKAAKKPAAKRQAFGKAGGMCLVCNFASGQQQVLSVRNGNIGLSAEIFIGDNWSIEMLPFC